MKYLLPIIIIFGITFNSEAQKKTHDHEKFVKKVTLSLAPSLITKWMPDEEAINYVAGKTDETKEELKQRFTELTEKVKDDAQFIIDNRIYANKYEEISVNVKQESPFKIADIVLHCKFQGDVFDVTLNDCIQTDQSWYLGGRIVCSGDGIKNAIVKQEEREEKPKGGLLGKIVELEENTEGKTAAENSDLNIYEAKRFKMVGTDASSQFVKHDLIGKELDGYYIDQEYKKVDTKIKYEAPEIMMDPNKFIQINGYDIVKSNFKAFYVADQMYVFTGEYWDILVREGAIRKLARVVKNDDTENYVLGELTQKLDKGPENNVSLMMGFKNKMAELVEDNEELAEKVQNKEDGYKFKNLDKIILEYNIWFDQQYPGKVEYLLKRVNELNNEEAQGNNNNDSESQLDKLGTELFNTVISENAENYKPYVYTKTDVENSPLKQELKEGLYEEMEGPNPKEGWSVVKKNISRMINDYKEINPKSFDLVRIEIKKNERQSEKIGMDIVELTNYININGEEHYFRSECVKFNDTWKVVKLYGTFYNTAEMAEEALEEAAEESLEIEGESEEAEEAEGEIEESEGGNNKPE